MKTASESAVKVTVNIKSVKLAHLTPAQREAAKHFWRKLISECKREVGQ